MADTITTSDQLIISMIREDDTKQNIRLQNPNQNLTQESIDSAFNYAYTNRILIDSKNETIFGSDTSTVAYEEYKQIRDLDLS